jgi:hypothetical protein
MRRLAMSLALVAFLVNPWFACTGQDEPEFTYGEAEMKAAVEGTWVLTLASGGANQEITLQVSESNKALPDQMQAMQKSQRSFVRSAAACGNRTFVSSAHACADSSSMPLAVSMVSGPDTYKDAEMSGSLMVGSLNFTRGELGLTLGSLRVFASISPDSTVVGTPSAGDGATSMTVVSLVRTTK